MIVSSGADGLIITTIDGDHDRSDHGSSSENRNDDARTASKFAVLGISGASALCGKTDKYEAGTSTKNSYSLGSYFDTSWQKTLYPKVHFKSATDADYLTIVVSLMHFWYDGFIWSVRKKQV